MQTKKCAVIVGPSIERADHQISQAKSIVDIVELRLDYFDTLDLKKLQQLINKHGNIPMIFTLRERCQGGLYQGTEQQRLLDIEQLANLNPDYFDLEYNIPIPLIDKFTKEHPEIKLIFSYHDFDKTPHDLQWINKLMSLVPAAIYKMAAMATTSTDVLRMLRFLYESRRNLIISTMGELGKNGRILSPIYGNFLTFICLDEKLNSAPGQMPLERLVETYHFDQLNKNTEVFGLIGNPVNKSPSQITHNRIFRALGLNAVYTKFPVNANELEEFCYHARKLGIRGFSVTMPLKEAVIPALKHLSEEAKAIGAVNTLTLKETYYVGDNTDGIGALNALETKGAVKGKRIVILGAGGAVRAIVYEAMKRGADPIIVNRTVSKAERVANQFGCDYAALSEIGLVVAGGYDCIINATSLEMPIQEEYLLPSAVVMDIMITPKETQFLRAAQVKGCSTVYGWEMFLHQAIGQFKLWFPGKQAQEAATSVIAHYHV